MHMLFGCDHLMSRPPLSIFLNPCVTPWFNHSRRATIPHESCVLFYPLHCFWQARPSTCPFSGPEFKNHFFQKPFSYLFHVSDERAEALKSREEISGSGTTDQDLDTRPTRRTNAITGLANRDEYSDEYSTSWTPSEDF